MNRIPVLISIIFSILLLSSCSFSRYDPPVFERSAVITSYRSLADMNDAYFELRENNFFEFSRRLFDSVKNTSYRGRYSRVGDTLFLRFNDKKGEELLGKKALVNSSKKEIIFFDDTPGKNRLIFN